MKIQCMVTILDNKEIAKGIFDMLLLAPDIAYESKAGQFVNVYMNEGQHILPRPISICEVDKETGILRIIFQVVGKGTNILSHLKKGEQIKLLGPLGNGYFIRQNISQKYVVIGGGIGIPPLLGLTKQLKGNVEVFLGARSNLPILTEEFKVLGANVHVTTDDGSEGYHGNIVDLLKRLDPKADVIYSCGPKVMLQAVSNWAKDKGISAQISMEERMACGIGACVGCVVKIKKKEDLDWNYLKVCKDGPVFLSDEVVWDD